MKNKIVISVVSVMLLASGLVAFANKPFNSDLNQVQINLSANTPNAPKVASSPAVIEGNYVCVKPLEVVVCPEKYVGKQVKFKATFDKFSTLGLDYKPAFRDSEKYISFLIKRDDVVDHTVPLSEMKIFIKRTEAEKFIDLDSGDIIEVYGKVFSCALTDAWVDAEKLVVITKKNPEKKA